MYFRDRHINKKKKTKSKRIRKKMKRNMDMTSPLLRDYEKRK